MDLGGQAHRVKFMIRDRGSNFTTAFNAVCWCRDPHRALQRADPRMNAIAEHWIGGCRRELLDRTLIWNQNHLRQTLRQYETHHNQHRPHRSLHSAAPLNRYHNRSFSGSTAYEDRLASVARSTNIAWSRDVD